MTKFESFTVQRSIKRHELRLIENDVELLRFLRKTFPYKNFPNPEEVLSIHGIRIEKVMFDGVNNKRFGGPHLDILVYLTTKPEKVEHTLQIDWKMYIPGLDNLRDILNDDLWEQARQEPASLSLEDEPKHLSYSLEEWLLFLQNDDFVLEEDLIISGYDLFIRFNFSWTGVPEDDPIAEMLAGKINTEEKTDER